MTLIFCICILVNFALFLIKLAPTTKGVSRVKNEQNKLMYKVRHMVAKLCNKLIFVSFPIVDGVKTFFEECTDVNLDSNLNPTGKYVCPTKVDENGMWITQPRYWGLCTEEYCPTSKGIFLTASSALKILKYATKHFYFVKTLFMKQNRNSLIGENIT